MVFIAVCVWPAYARAAQTFFFSKSLVLVLVLVGVHVRYILFLALVHLQQDDYADNADERVANEDGEAGGFANEYADGEGVADEDADGEGVAVADFKDKDNEDEDEAHLVLDVLHNLEQRELLPGMTENGEVHIFWDYLPKIDNGQAHIFPSQKKTMQIYKYKNHLTRLYLALFCVYFIFKYLQSPHVRTSPAEAAEDPFQKKFLQKLQIQKSFVSLCL